MQSGALDVGYLKDQNLGPLLFLIYIIDLPNCFDQSVPRTVLLMIQIFP
jgi:hypothetical protein